MLYCPFRLIIIYFPSLCHPNRRERIRNIKSVIAKNSILFRILTRPLCSLSRETGIYAVRQTLPGSGQSRDENPYYCYGYQPSSCSGWPPERSWGYCSNCRHGSREGFAWYIPWFMLFCFSRPDFSAIHGFGCGRARPTKTERHGPGLFRK